MADAIKVGEIVLIKEGDEFVGVEVGFAPSVMAKAGAVTVLNMLKGAMENTGWVFNTIGRVADAQADEEPSEGGDTNAESTEAEAGTTNAH